MKIQLFFIWDLLYTIREVHNHSFSFGNTKYEFEKLELWPVNISLSTKSGFPRTFEDHGRMLRHEEIDVLFQKREKEVPESPFPNDIKWIFG